MHSQTYVAQNQRRVVIRCTGDATSLVVTKGDLT